MCTIFKVFIEFVLILLLFYVLFCFFFWLRSMWDLCSLTRDQTTVPALKVKSQAGIRLEHQGSPQNGSCWGKIEVSTGLHSFWQL